MTYMNTTSFNNFTDEPLEHIPAQLRHAYISAIDLELVDGTADHVMTELLSPSPSRVVFMNAHCCNQMRRDARYAKAVNSADMRLPDGIGIEIAAKLSGEHLRENLNGTDFTPKLLAEAAKRGLSVYLLGGRPGTADAAAARLCYDIPGLKIAGTCNGYKGFETQAVIRDINQSKADIVLVALGVPKQDIWLSDHAHEMYARLTMGVGAYLDFVAGNVARAPIWMRESRLEWVWRLMMEPRRMAGRYLIGNFSFLWHAGCRTMANVNLTNAMRRMMDIAISGGALLALAPIFLFLAVLIMLDSRGPAFFSQTRVGLKATKFRVLKFRSMFIDAEERRAELLASSERKGICFKSKSDPRITRMGRFLRRTSLDELPQLINVFLGDMSIVGPRPALPSEVDAYPQRAISRLDVKPGITGIWQISGRADIGFDKMIDMDLAYTKSRTILLDLMIILLTFRAVLSGRGAY